MLHKIKGSAYKRLTGENVTETSYKKDVFNFIKSKPLKNKKIINYC